jgi:hypothetical protein
MSTMTNEELRDLVAGLAELQQRQIQATSLLFQETDLRIQETGRQIRESELQTREQSRETSREIKETGRQIRELKQQLGGLSEKFGSFTEGMAFPSMRKLLENRFHMDVVMLRALARKNGSFMELDVMAYSNSKVNEVYIVEVKSHLRQEGLEQMKKNLREFHDFFPGHAGKKVYGILAAVDFPESLREKVLQEGIYLARIHDEEFELQVPADFQPRAF